MTTELRQLLLDDFIKAEIDPTDRTKLVIYEIIDWCTEISLNKKEVEELITKLTTLHNLMEHN